MRLGLQDAYPSLSRDFTMTVWVKPTGTAAGQAILSVGSIYGAGGYQLEYHGTPGNESLALTLSDGSGAPQVVTHALSTSLQNVWHHIGVAVDVDGDVALVLDGQEVVGVPYTEDFSTSLLEYQMTLGSLFDGSFGYFDGYLDDLRFFDERLATPNIAAVSWYHFPVGGYQTKRVEYAYDVSNQLIERRADLDGASGPLPMEGEFYLYDAGQMVLGFDETGQVEHRYLWGAGVDQLISDEQIDVAGTAGEVIWALTDNLGSVRDLIKADTDGVRVVRHKTFGSFGDVVRSQPLTNDAEDVVFGYTGRQFDDATGLQNNLHRWYDAGVGRWISEDPIGFEAGDANLYRYVGNGATNAVDPSGLDAFLREEFRIRLKPQIEDVDLITPKKGECRQIRIHRNATSTFLIQLTLPGYVRSRYWNRGKWILGLASHMKSCGLGQSISE